MSPVTVPAPHAMTMMIPPSPDPQLDLELEHDDASSLLPRHDLHDPESALALPPAAPSSAKDHDAQVGLEDIVVNLLSYYVERLVAESKPYFDIDTKTFLRRITYAVIPRHPNKSSDLIVKPDFYGPLIIALSLSSALHFSAAKPSSLGFALFFTFSSLLGAALVLNVAMQYHIIRERQTNSLSGSLSGLDRSIAMVGYSFMGPLLVVLLSHRIPWILFVIIRAFIELGSAVSLGILVLKSTSNKRPWTSLVVACVHIFWLSQLT